MQLDGVVNSVMKLTIDFRKSVMRLSPILMKYFDYCGKNLEGSISLWHFLIQLNEIFLEKIMITNGGLENESKIIKLFNHMTYIVKRVHMLHLLMCFCMDFGPDMFCNFCPHNYTFTLSFANNYVNLVTI